jgi:hypothetical protein
VIITVEAQNKDGMEFVKKAVAELKALLAEHVGGEFSEYFLP